MGEQTDSVAVSAGEADRLGLERTLRGGTGLPETVRKAFEPVKDAAEAEAYTRGLTRSHYENFSVVSTLLPKRLRQDFCNVYAFCRIADDLGDEVPERALAVRYLGEFRHGLVAMYAGLEGASTQPQEQPRESGAQPREQPPECDTRLREQPGNSDTQPRQRRRECSPRQVPARDAVVGSQAASDARAPAGAPEFHAPPTPSGTLTPPQSSGCAPTSAVFVALAETVKRHAIPMQPFDDLIRAFEQDQMKSRYETFAEVVDYCTKSADPVGRIVLYMCGYRDEQRQQLSDNTCTALQLINFWQDVRRDMLERDRIYLPADDMQRFGVTEADLRSGRVTDKFRQMIKFEVERTEAMFDEGAKLLPLLDRAYRKQIALFGKGGRAICDAVRRQKFDTLTSRPRLSKWQKARLILGTLLGGR